MACCVYEIKTMSENTVSRAEFERALRQAQRRKQEIATLQAERDQLKSQIETFQSERDQAYQEMESITEQFKKFTDENELFKTNQFLNAQIKERDLIDAFSSLPDGQSYQPGVTLQNVLEASGLDFDSIEEITEEFVTDAIAKAQLAKPYLFTSAPAAPVAAEPQGDVRPETAVQPPALKAFGAQAVGGGSAPQVVRPDPAKTVDWTDPAAVQAFAASRDERIRN